MAGPFYNRTLEELSNEHSECRGRMAKAMRDVNPAELNAARNADREVRGRVQAISDQRAYGSGCDFDPRGHRPLERGSPNVIYSGSLQNSNRSAVYPETKSPHAHTPRDDGKPGGW